MRTFWSGDRWLTETDLGEVRLATAEEICIARTARTAREDVPLFLTDEELARELANRQGPPKQIPPVAEESPHRGALKDALRGIWDLIRGRR